MKVYPITVGRTIMAQFSTDRDQLLPLADFECEHGCLPGDPNCCACWTRPGRSADAHDGVDDHCTA